MSPPIQFTPPSLNASSRSLRQQLCSAHSPPRTCLPTVFHPPSKPRSFHSIPRSQSQSSPRFTYHISASYSDKRHPLNPTRNLFNFNPYIRLKKTTSNPTSTQRNTKNRPQSGEDAFFISNVGDTGAVAFGVVDGVGGWQSSGVDPADFAHSLCDYMAGAAGRFPKGFKESDGASLRPRDLLEVGYRKVIQDKTIFAGGSTACVATAEPDGTLQVANLGDSGFLHLGQNAVRYNSPPQTHAFNTPYQLSKIPPRMLVQALTFGGVKPFSELPGDAAVTSHRLRHGDVLVLATDGVWDNLSPSDALGVVSRTMRMYGGWEEEGGDDASSSGAERRPAAGAGALRGSRNLRALTSQRSGVGGREGAVANTLQALLALAVTREAKEASLDRKRDGPFAREVQKHYPQENWHGGKADDICTVVVVAVEEGV